VFSISHVCNSFNHGNASEIQRELAEITARREALTEISLEINLEDLEAANPEIEDPDLVYPGQFVTNP
jgi:hypothetical protein